MSLKYWFDPGRGAGAESSVTRDISGSGQVWTKQRLDAATLCVDGPCSRTFLTSNGTGLPRAVQNTFTHVRLLAWTEWTLYTSNSLSVERTFWT